MKNLSTATGVLLAVLSLAGQALAGDSDARKSFDRQSRASGFGRTDVALFQRDKSSGVSAVTTGVSNALPAVIRNAIAPLPGANNTETPAAAVTQWSLSVSADGAVVELIGPPPSKLVQVGARSSDATLIAAAQDVVKGILAPAMQVDLNQLYVLKVRHEVRTEVELATQARKQFVAASEVIFGRVLDGLPVVGPGSKIIVMLYSDATLAGIRADWSALSTTKERQPVVAVAAVASRAVQHTRTKGTDVNVYKRFECGYYDSGATAASSLVQSACLVQTIDSQNGLAVEEFVPAGAAVKPDAAWPLAGRVLGTAVGQPAIPPSAP